NLKKRAHFFSERVTAGELGDHRVGVSILLVNPLPGLRTVLFFQPAVRIADLYTLDDFLHFRNCRLGNAGRGGAWHLAAGCYRGPQSKDDREHGKSKMFSAHDSLRKEHLLSE